MRARPLTAAALLAFSAAPGVLTAQAGPGSGYERPRILVGYVANAPDVLLGGMVAVLPPFLDGWGLYLDAKRGLEDPGTSEFLQQDLTRTEVETLLFHTRVQEKTYWYSFSAAAVRAVGNDLMLYIGGGASSENHYVEYLDPDLTAGNFGYYWVADAERTGWRPNIMGGLQFRLTRYLAAQFGLESAPTGLTVGVLGAF